MQRMIAILLMLLSAASVTAEEAAVRKILVIYSTEDGSTHTLAEAVKEGASQIPQTEVSLKSVREALVQDVLEADGIIVGSPVHKAMPTAELMQFLQLWPAEGELAHKVGAAFVSAGGISAGEETALLDMLHAMMICQMMVVGGPDWRLAFGAYAITDEGPFLPTSSLAPFFTDKAKALGKRVATIVHHLIPFQAEKKE